MMNEAKLAELAKLLKGKVHLLMFADAPAPALADRERAGQLVEQGTWGLDDELGVSLEVSGKEALAVYDLLVELVGP